MIDKILESDFVIGFLFGSGTASIVIAVILEVVR